MGEHHSALFAQPARITRRGFLAATLCGIVVAPGSRADALDTRDYSTEEFAWGGIRRTLLSKGSGPTVFVFHEINGLTANCLTLGDDLVARGFRVVIPRFFGSAPGPLGYFKACEGRTIFACYGRTDYGSVSSWIKALARMKGGQNGFGAIGNCLTGALPLLMLQSRRCVAPVLCQPALPLTYVPWIPGSGSALGLAPVDLEAARRMSQVADIPILGIRYASDSKCPAARFATLRSTFGSRFLCLELEGEGHSTLIAHRCDRAFDTVVAFLRSRLVEGEWPTLQADCRAAACSSHAPGDGR